VLPALFSATTLPLEDILLTKRVLPVALLIVFWCWETGRPFFGKREERLKHAGRNLAFAVFNTVVLGLVFGSLTVMVAVWTEKNQLGLLNHLGLVEPFRFVLAMVLLDGWMYLWHRANHAVPFLWRFHRMHHSDRTMDVTTATRFHLGEHVGSAVLRLGLIPLLGWELWDLVVYDMLVVAVTQFHHADISVGRWDRWLRLLMVSPYMHKVHHSNQQPETDSNFSTVLSIWDRLAGTFRMRSDPATLVFGLEGFTDPSWQTLWGMWKTPFVKTRRSSPTIGGASVVPVPSGKMTTAESLTGKDGRNVEWAFTAPESSPRIDEDLSAKEQAVKFT
jgi:sterol desaturase/sphingolipid hydroxylase (fatty acid hydroxylase superfamily)